MRVRGDESTTQRQAPPELLLIASRRIEPCEEICWNYGENRKLDRFLQGNEYIDPLLLQTDIDGSYKTFLRRTKTGGGGDNDQLQVQTLCKCQVIKKCGVGLRSGTLRSTSI